MNGKVSCRGGRVAGLVACALLAREAAAAVATDDFSVAHDFLADGVHGTGWDGFIFNVYGGDASVAAADANVSNAGRLTFRSTFGNWERNDDDGIFLYRMVEGDFDATVLVASMNMVQWHDGGLMARVAETNGAGSGEDWVAVKFFAASNQNGHRSTDNGVSTTLASAPARPWLRLARTGNVLASYWSADGVTWILIGASTRNDMNGLPLQVGLWQATFSANEGVAQFDNFALRTPSSWVLAGGGSWATAANWTNSLPDGAGAWAAIGRALTSNARVTLDGHRKVGRLVFDATNSVACSVEAGSVAPTSALVIDDRAGGSHVAPGVEVRFGSHGIAVPVVLSNGVTVSTSAGTALTMNGAIAGVGGLVKTGAGMLTFASTNTYGGETRITAGGVRLAAIPAGAKAYYLFDNASALGQDSSGLGNDLTVGGGAPAYDGNGRIGGAVYLNGSSFFSRSAFPAGVPTGASPYTLALWVKDDGSPNVGGFCGWGNSAANQCNNFRFNGNNQLNNYWWGANDWTLAGLSTNPKDGAWHHVAVTWDGAVSTMYVDGQTVGTRARTGLNAQAANFVVGKTSADVALKGWIDELLVADRALEAAEIRSLMAGAKPANLLPEATALTVEVDGTLYLDGASQSVASLGGGGRVMNGTLSDATLTVGGSTNAAFSGTLCGPLALSKAGSGSLTLSGLNVNAGGVAVKEGVLTLTQHTLSALLAQSVAWFDAADAATLTTNAAGQVTLWANKGAAGATLDAVQTFEGTGPTVQAGALNGRSVLAVNNTTGLRTSANLGVAGAQNRTLFAVGCRKSSGNMCFAHTGDGADNLAFGIISQNDRLYAYTWGPLRDVTFPVRPNNAYEIYDLMLSGGTGSANLLSGGSVSSGTATVAPNTTDTPLYLGSRFAATNQGSLAEVILFNRALTASERMGVEAYLLAKWFSGGRPFAWAGGPVSVAAGAALNLGGTAQTLSALSGDGVVSNGTLTVTGEIDPGGAGAVGVLTLVGVTLGGGTLAVDLAAEGGGDRLQVSGALDLSALTLRVRNPHQLQAGERYLLAACSPGALTGPFAATDIGTDGWYVSYNGVTGEVRLLPRGLLIMVH